jgi:hypothetical protein
MHIPPLISEAPRGDPAIPGQGGRVILGGDVLKNIREGGRVRFGAWFDPCHTHGVDADYFALETLSDYGIEGSGGYDRTVARPFVNAQTGRLTTELVGYLPPIGEELSGSGALCGSVHVDMESSFWGTGVRYARCWAESCDGTSRADLLLGYRYLTLDERVAIFESLTSLDPSFPNVAFDVFDSFRTDSDFHGADLGMRWTGKASRWSIDLLAKVAFGYNRQRIHVDGFTTLTNTFTGESQTSTVAVPADGPGGNFTGGGLLAQRSNIGSYARNKFSTVPEIGLTLGYHVNQHVKATVGYNLIVWTNVLRAGRQIDPEVNLDLVPDEAASVSGPVHPVVPYDETTFWAQGFHAGLEVGW